MADDGISRRALLAAIGASAGGASLLTGRSRAVLTDSESFRTAIGGETLDLKVGYETAVTRDGETSVVAANPDLGQNGAMDRPPYDDPCSVLPDPSSVPNPLFDLQDVRPGDRGRALLSVHVCGTDATVSLEGELTANRENGVVPTERPDRTGETGELVDLLEARLWYDLDCDGERDQGEPTIATGTLREVLERLAEGVALSPDPTTEPCHRLGTVTADQLVGREGEVFEFTMDGEPVRVRLSEFVTRNDSRDGAGKGGGEPQRDETGGDGTGGDGNGGDGTAGDENEGAVNGPGTKNESTTTMDETSRTATAMTTPTADELTTANETLSTTEATVPTSTAERSSETAVSKGNGPPGAGTDIVAVDFEVLEPAGAGLCRVDVETRDRETQSLGCVGDGTIESAPRGNGDGADQSREAIQSLTLYGCSAPAATCLPAGETTCLGFEWHLPDVDGVAKAQTDAVAFDLGFSATQCGPTGGATE